MASTPQYLTVGEHPHHCLERDSCPINNLPPELLSLIFQSGVSKIGKGGVFTHWGDLHHVEQTGPDGIDAGEAGEVKAGRLRGRGLVASLHLRLSFPVLVSHVCRYWRSVAISTASLWTTITLSNTWRTRLSYNSSYELVPSHLERSQDLPINVDWELDHPNLSWLLTPHAHRWRSIKIEFRTHDCMLAFLEAASHPSVPVATQLATLQLYCNACRPERASDAELEYIKQQPLFGGSAPRLENVTLWGVPVDWNQSWISSASNLTCLQLAFHIGSDRPSWAQFATILRGAPKLEKLGLNFSGPRTRNGIGDPNATVQLPNLTCLTLRREHPIGLLSKLCTPSLQSLDLRSCSVFDSSSLEESYQLSADAEERIDHLLFPYSKGDVEKFYSQLQNLKSLRIMTPGDNSYSLHKFLDILQSPPATGHSVLFPSLEKLHVATIFRSHVIHKIVQARKDVGRPLKSLYLECKEVFDDDDANSRWFEDNVEEFIHLQSVTKHHMFAM